jgi:DNA (cytosine-5)-methyltransferase 1
MNVLDLFSGIGGFSLGLERAGMKTIAFCEIEEFPRKVLAKHWPDVPIYKDVKDVTKKRLEADGVAMPDVLTGGFPCQDLSSAGKRAGIWGERSGLWGELYRIMCEIRPKYTIFENVTGLLSGDGGGWFERLLTDVSEGGFNLEWECVPASSVGAPHRRDRVYGVAYPNENGWLRVFSKANFEEGRNMGNDIWPDRFFGWPGVWINWQGEAQREVFGEPIIATKNDGIPSWVDENSALGNAVVPQIAEIIGRAIMEIEGIDK